MNLREFGLSWGILLIGVFMNVLGIYTVKVKINALGAISFESLGAFFSYFATLLKSPVALAGALAVILAPIPYAIAISRMQISTAYPVSIALTFLLLLPLSILFLGETMTISKSIAIVMILASLFLLYR